MTWRLGVVGSPIAHSLSPQLHEAGLRLAGLESYLERIDITLERASEISDLFAAGFNALSVTSPLKRAAFDLFRRAHRRRDPYDVGELTGWSAKA